MTLIRHRVMTLRLRPDLTSRRTVAADTVSSRAAASMVSRSGAITLPAGVGVCGELIDCRGATIGQPTLIGDRHHVRQRRVHAEPRGRVFGQESREFRAHVVEQQGHGQRPKVARSHGCTRMAQMMASGPPLKYAVISTPPASGAIL